LQKIQELACLFPVQKAFDAFFAKGMEEQGTINMELPPINEGHTNGEANSVAEAKIFPGGGEMEERVRTFDWSRTPLGPIESWSPALRMMTGFLLANRFPLLLWWGPQFIQIYNDAYIYRCWERNTRFRAWAGR
jgi:hypothetical protein